MICRQSAETLIKFSAIQPKGMSEALWQPTEADVHETLDDCKNPVVQIARNLHYFSDYRLYDPDEAKLAAPKMTLAATVHALELAAHPYLELPLPQLIKRIPQLKGISPAQDQQALPMILQQTGKQVDSFFANLVDLSAREDITQQRLASGTLAGGMPLGQPWAGVSDLGSRVTDETFRNTHHYSDYLLYRVSTKMVDAQ